MTEYEAAIIKRCTSLDGLTVRWQAVATMLGINVTDARSRYEPIVFGPTPSVLVCEEVPPETESLRSPHVRALLRTRIVSRLKGGRVLSSSVLSEVLCTTPKTILGTLIAMKREGIVKNTEKDAWSLAQRDAA